MKRRHARNEYRVERNFFPLGGIIFLIKLPAYILSFIIHYLFHKGTEIIEVDLKKNLLISMYNDFHICQLSPYHIEELLNFYTWLFRRLNLQEISLDLFTECGIPSYLALWSESDLKRIIYNLKMIIEDSEYFLKISSETELERITFLKNFWIYSLREEFFPEGECFARYINSALRPEGLFPAHIEKILFYDKNMFIANKNFFILNLDLFLLIFFLLNFVLIFHYGLSHKIWGSVFNLLHKTPKGQWRIADFLRTAFSETVLWFYAFIVCEAIFIFFFVLASMFLLTSLNSNLKYLFVVYAFMISLSVLLYGFLEDVSTSLLSKSLLYKKLFTIAGYWNLIFFTILTSIYPLTVFGSWAGRSSLKTLSFSVQTFQNESLIVLTNTVSYNHVHLFFDMMFIYDSLVLNTRLFIIFFLSSLMLCSTRYLTRMNDCNFLFRFDFLITMIFSLIGLFFLISSFDFLYFFITLELCIFCSYSLILQYSSKVTSEAAMKYFGLGSITSALLLFGISLLYGTTRMTKFIYFNQILQFLCPVVPILKNPYFLLGVILVVISALFKIAAAPFHQWSLDAYEGAPLFVTAYFIIVFKFALFLVFFRILGYVFFNISFLFDIILVVSALLSLIVGAFGGLVQFGIKRFFAYAGINHTGYILAVISIGTFNGFQIGILYLIVYSLLNLFVFCFLLYETSYNRKTFTYLTDLTGYGQIHFGMAMQLVLIFFSLAGIPPLAGFFSKFLVLFLLVESGHVVLITGFVVSTLVSTFYYIRIIKIILFDDSKYFDSKRNFLGFSYHCINFQNWSLVDDSDGNSKLYLIVHLNFCLLSLCNLYFFFLLPFILAYTETLTIHLLYPFLPNPFQ